MSTGLADGSGDESPTPQANLTIVIIAMASSLAGILAVVVVGMTAVRMLAATLAAAVLPGCRLMPAVSGSYAALAERQ
jgi:hypothetical protein